MHQEYPYIVTSMTGNTDQPATQEMAGNHTHQIPVCLPLTQVMFEHLSPH